VAVYSNDSFKTSFLSGVRTAVNDNSTARIYVYKGTLPADYDDIDQHYYYGTGDLYYTDYLGTYFGQTAVNNGVFELTNPGLNSWNAAFSGTATWFLMIPSNTSTLEKQGLVGTVTDIANLSTTPAPMVLTDNNVVAGQPLIVTQFSMKVL